MILAVTAQQAEVIKFAQMDGNVTLVLRSPDDFIDPNDQPIPPLPVPDARPASSSRPSSTRTASCRRRSSRPILPAQAP